MILEAQCDKMMRHGLADFVVAVPLTGWLFPNLSWIGCHTVKFNIPSSGIYRRIIV